MSKTPSVEQSKAPITTEAGINYLLKLQSKIVELLEEQVTQQAEILDQLKNRDLIGEDFSITRDPDFERDL